MSQLVGTESLVDGKQVIVVNQRDYKTAKRQFGSVLPVVGVNGPDTDITPLFGRGVVLIGNDANIHAPVLHTVRGDATIKVIEQELTDLGEWAETPDALEWAKELAFVYEGEPSTASAQDSETPAGPLPVASDTAADATLPEMPAYLAESLPVEALGYPDPSAFIDHGRLS